MLLTFMSTEIKFIYLIQMLETHFFDFEYLVIIKVQILYNYIYMDGVCAKGLMSKNTILQ